jgi:hypothetical protein
MEGSDDSEMSEEERYEEFHEKLKEELPEDAQTIQMGSGKPEQEEWSEMMPDQKPGLAARVVGWIFKLVVMALIFAPAFGYWFVGIEIAVVAFMVVLLFFVAHLI